jgi:hypothetical protein
VAETSRGFAGFGYGFVCAFKGAIEKNRNRTKTTKATGIREVCMLKTAFSSGKYYKSLIVLAYKVQIIRTTR